MIVPDTQIFAAGDVQTGSDYNGSFTDLGNFILAKNVYFGISRTNQTVDNAATTGILFPVTLVDRDNGHSSAPLNAKITSATYISNSVAEFTTLEPHGYVAYDTVTTSGFSDATYNLASVNVLSVPSSTKFRAYKSTNVFTNPWSGTAGTSVVVPDNRYTIKRTVFRSRCSKIKFT